MKLKYNTTLCTLFFVSCILAGYLFWLSHRPVEIVAIHHRSSGFSDVLVKGFPFTDKGKIAWWMKNKDRLRDKYGVPHPDSDGSFYLTFWLFGEGYKERGKYDRLCFDDIKTKENCIEKDAVFSVDNSRNMGMVFRVYDGTYRLQKNGEIVKFIEH